MTLGEQLVTLAGWWFAMAWVIGWGLRCRRHGEHCEKKYRHRCCVLGGLGWLAMTGYFATQPAHERYPLHVCDLAGLVALAALCTQARWLRALLYFWALGLTAQAFITPVNVHPVTHVRWWFFWGSHAAVVAAALYDVVVLRFRPQRGDLLRAWGLSVAYVLLMMLINEPFGWNYGYVGSQGEPPGVVALLGAWPGRVGWMALIGTGVFVLLWLPWGLRGRWGQRGLGLGAEHGPPHRVDKLAPDDTSAAS